MLQVSTNTSLPVEDMETLLREAELEKVIRRGELVQGVIMRVDQEGILVSIGNKSEGIVSSKEMRSLSEEELSSLKVGEEILTQVLETEREDGSAILSVDKAKEGIGWLDIEQKFSSRESVEGTIMGFNRGGALVDVNGLKGFVPISHLGGGQRGSNDGWEEEMERRVGESVHLKIIEVDRFKKRAIFSEKVALQEERESQKERILQELQEGEVRRGRVTGICDFGAFVDLGGADGLIHISELSWEPIQSTSQVLNVADEVDVYVMKVDHDSKRIALSLRRTGPEPWDTVPDRYQVDQLISGTITKLTHFGAFARIEGSVEGLIHISELSYDMINHPKEVVREGDVLTLKILKIEPERKRLALSLKQAEEI
ncbi:MAG: S1 RNA-binding domain-containing protein [Chloroflexota bacterium]